MSIMEQLEADEPEFVKDRPPISNDSPTEEYLYPDASPGTCKVCGQPATSKAGKYCAEHKASHDKRKGNKGRPKKSGKAEESSLSTSDLKARLQASFQMLGFGWSMQGPKITPEVMQRLFPEYTPEQLAMIEHPGMTLTNQAEQIAEAFAVLADQNPTIRKWLEVASSPSGYLAVGMSVMPVVTTAQMWYGVVMPRVREVQNETNGGT